ncbi:MAG: hypothetical protein IPO09_00055 [Anaeromyxobacter sp.]|nr:hypothetical protein [Anaeromyxobacter sp.]MBL0278438.1 hypothetical protein [Anaeromyxobacter sp.]
MSRIAADLRRETASADLKLTPGERLERALRLGDSDAALYAAAHGLDLEAARSALQRQRAVGRRPSRCAER